MTNTVKVMDYNSIQQRGTQALIAELGPVGMIRFLEQFDNGGSGDYTKEKYEVPELSIDEIVNM